MLLLLQRLGDAAVIEEFIAEVVTRDYDGSEDAALVASLRILDAKKAAGLLAELMRQRMPDLSGHCVDLLHALAFKSDLTADETGRVALRRIAEAAVSKLDEIGKGEARGEWLGWWVREKTHAVDTALVAKLLDALGILAAPALRAEAVEKLIARPNPFDPVTILVPALRKIRQQDAAARRLWEHSADFLVKRSGHPPASPTDWRQDVNLSCSCADCRGLQAFALDPDERTRRFSVRKDRRQHLHQIIERHCLDMTHVTERRGSPQTLICTKDRRSYKRRCEQYRGDIAALASLTELSGTIGASATWLEKIGSARAQAARWTPA